MTKSRHATYGFKGKKHSAETRAKISASNKGIPKKGIPGELNPAKRADVREKMKKAWEKRRLVPVSDETKKKTSDTLQGMIASGKWKPGKPKSPWNKGLKWTARTGPRNHKWKGGVTPVNEAIRKSPEYKAWRKAVFERDGYACVWCGNNSSGDLNADHIKPFAEFPEIRLDVDNGRTLCVECHMKTESYPQRLKKPRQGKAKT